MFLRVRTDYPAIRDSDGTTLGAAWDDPTHTTDRVRTGAHSASDTRAAKSTRHIRIYAAQATRQTSRPLRAYWRDRFALAPREARRPLSPSCGCSHYGIGGGAQESRWTRQGPPPLHTHIIWMPTTVAAFHTGVITMLTRLPSTRHAIHRFLAFPSCGEGGTCTHTHDHHASTPEMRPRDRPHPTR